MHRKCADVHTQQPSTQSDEGDNRRCGDGAGRDGSHPRRRNVRPPFPVRDIRRRRLSINEVKTYRDIALTRGHAGRGLGKAKNAFKMGAVQAGKLIDVMRQVDVSAAGSLGRHDFSLALDRAGVRLPAEDKDVLFRSLSSARTAGIGCDIEMFAHLVNFWAGSAGDTTPVAMAAGRRERQQASDHIFPGTSVERQAGRSPAVVSPDSRGRHHRAAPDEDGGLKSAPDDRPPSSLGGLRDYAAGDGGEEGAADSGRRSWVDNIGSENLRVRSSALKQQRLDVPRGPDGGGLGGHSGHLPGSGGQPEIVLVASPTAAAAGKQNSFRVSMGDIMNHAATEDERAYSRGASRHESPGDTIVSGSAARGGCDEQDGDSVVVEGGHFSTARAPAQDSGGTRDAEGAPDQAYMHSLGYGNLASVLPILLDRRSALETSLDRLDQGASGRVRPGDFMAAVRQVGIALSAVQEANMMDLLHRMGAVSEGEENCQWVHAPSALAAICLAGEKAGGRFFQDKPRSPLKEGTRLLDALSDSYADVHVSLLPSPILLGPNAIEARRAAPDDGARGVFVTAGSLRNALRKAGVLLGDADERVLWRLLLRRAQELVRRGDGDNNSGITASDSGAPTATTVMKEGEREGTANLLARGMIPLPLLDAVVGFDADAALRARRELQQREAHPTPSVPPPYRDHLGWWAGPGTPGKARIDEGEDADEAPLLLQKARLKLKAMGDTMAEREQAVVRCLPKLGPKGEQGRLPRVDLTRLLQQLRVGVRSGELQNLWYHMDRNKITRQAFRRILLDDKDTLPVTFPASPYPYPAGPIGPASDVVSYTGDTTPKGGISVTGARLQRVLNRAAYEDNVRHGAAGSAMTRALRGGGEGQDTCRRDESSATSSSTSSPDAVSSHDSNCDGGGDGADHDNNSNSNSCRGLPILLRRAVRRVKELENGEEVVSALVPDMGRVREGMRITRGGIQRVLHGLGVIPHSGELQQLWWSLEKGGVGDPRITVEDFRDLLVGRTKELVLLQDWNALGETFKNERDSYGHIYRVGEQGSPGSVVRRGAASKRRGDDDEDSPVSRAVGEVRTSLGLVRRRVRGIIRGCEDRDLSGVGSVTEEDFLAVLRDQGILQQLRNPGLSALRHAAVVESRTINRTEPGGVAPPPTAVVRYTGLVGAIDAYLEAVMSWDESEAALRLGVTDGSDGGGGGGDDGSDGAAREEGDGPPRPLASAASDVGHALGELGGVRPRGDRFATPVPQPQRQHQRQDCSRSAKRTILVGGDSPNTVARATRGWDNDAPVVAAGMRHYPQRTCTMAGLMGNGGLLKAMGGEHERERKPPPSASPTGTSAARKGEFRWSDQISNPTALPPSPPFSAGAARPASSATQPPRDPACSTYTTPGSAGSNSRPVATISGAGHLGDSSSAGEIGTTMHGSGDGVAAAPPVDFRPAGGAPGLDRPDGSGGRRGSVGKSLGLAGGGVSQSIRQGVEEAAASVTRALAMKERGYGGSGVRFGDEASSSIGEGGGCDRSGGVRCAGSPEPFLGGGGEGGKAAQPSNFSRRRQSNTGQLRELVEAWPEMAAAAKTDGQSSSSDNASDDGNADDTPSVGQQRVAELRKNAARALLSDRSLLAGVFRQLSGTGSQYARNGLDKARLVKLFRYARMPLDLSEEEAEGLAEDVLQNCGAPTARFASITTFLAKIAGSSSSSRGGGGIRSASESAEDAARASLTSERGDHEPADFAEEEIFRAASSRIRGDPVAQSIRRNILQGRSELRLAAGDDDSRLSCAVHLRRAFRKRRKSLGGDPGGVDDCSVAATDLNGVLQDLGVVLSPTQAAFLIRNCRVARTPGRRPAAGGMDEAPVRAGDVLAFFRELLSDD